MSVNCDDTDGAKLRSLKRILGLVKSAAAKGLVPTQLIGAVSSKLAESIQAQYNLGANPSNLHDLVTRGLGAAVDAASASAAQSGASPMQVGAVRVGLASLLGGDVASAAGGFFDPRKGAFDRLSDRAEAVTPAIAAKLAPGSIFSGVSTDTVTASEIRAFLSGSYTGDNDDFAVALWVGKTATPGLMLAQLGYAKRLHNTVVKVCARHYKKILYGNPDHPVRLGRIIYGVVSEETVRRELEAGPTSRHLLGQAVNFSIIGVDDRQVVQDILNGVIDVDVGTFGQVNGVHASLPFTINGTRVEKIHLWADRGIPGFIGYNIL